MAAHTTSSRTQPIKEPSSSSPSCPPLVRCTMVCGALGLLGTAGWLMYLGWMFAVFLFTSYFLLHISLITLFWWLSVTLIIEGIAIIRTYTSHGNQRYREEGFWLALALLFPLLIVSEAVYNALSAQQIHVFSSSPQLCFFGIIVTTLSAVCMWYSMGYSALIHSKAARKRLLGLDLPH